MFVVTNKRDATDRAVFRRVCRRVLYALWMRHTSRHVWSRSGFFKFFLQLTQEPVDMGQGILSERQALSFVVPFSALDSAHIPPGDLSNFALKKAVGFFIFCFSLLLFLHVVQALARPQWRIYFTYPPGR